MSSITRVFGASTNPHRQTSENGFVIVRPTMDAILQHILPHSLLRVPPPRSSCVKLNSTMDRVDNAQLDIAFLADEEVIELSSPRQACKPTLTTDETALYSSFGST